MGGHPGNGKQWVSWIHIKDLLNIIFTIIKSNNLKGPINATAPNPVRMKELCKVLGQQLNRPSWLHPPEFMLKMILGELSTMICTGQNVIPDKLTKAGFNFSYPTLNEAIGTF